MSKNKRLTKEDLQKYYSIYKITQDENQEWHVWTWGYPVGTTRINPLNGERQEKTYIELPIFNRAQQNKKVEDKVYKIVLTKCRGFDIYLPLARVLYAYFFEEVPEGMQVDHIDNNPSNNSLDNLQLLTPSENCKKKFKDNLGIKINGRESQTKQ